MHYDTTDNQTTITVASINGFADSGTILIDWNEQMTYTGIINTTF